MDWRLAEGLSFFEKITPAQFREKLVALDYNKPESIHDFHTLLNKPNIFPIVIGKVGSEVLQLCAEPSQLESHPQDELIDVNDGRATLDSVILGLWDQLQDCLNGKHSNEGSATEDHPSQSTIAAQAPLETFLQLGLLYSRPDSSITAKTDLNRESGWDSTNYVLVANTQDDSIWVLWKKFILSHETAEYELAKDVWPYGYAVFPGMPVDETVIYARLADRWDDLNPSADLHLARIVRAPSARNGVEETMLVSAMRTPQGGIRRYNDFRAIGPR